MTWWYVTSKTVTCLVEENDGVITDAAPVYRSFIGQPAKDFGDWLRSKGEVRFLRIPVMTHIFSWGNNEKRALLKGRPCRVLAHGSMRSVMVEFADGQREIVSFRSLKQLPHARSNSSSM